MVQPRARLWLLKRPDEVGGEDVFVHMETVRHAHLGELQPGQQLMARIAPSSKGLTAVEIAAATNCRNNRRACRVRGVQSPGAGAKCSANVPIEEARRPVRARVPLRFTPRRGDHRFMVEIAATPEQQERGLMFRRELGPTRA